MSEDAQPKTVKVKRMVEIEPKNSDIKAVKMVSSDMTKRYSESKELDSHLFKLVEAPVIKYLGKENEALVTPDQDPQNFVPMGHAHIFRTIDADGKKHQKCVPIGGHFHNLVMEQSDDPKNVPKIIGMSGPMRTVQKKVAGRLVYVDEPVNTFDNHIHDVEYLKSELIRTRVANVEAAKVMATEALKVPSKPAGVI